MDWGKRRPKGTSGRELIIKLYDTVQLALWSGLVAFVIWFCVLVLPRMPLLQAEAQTKLTLDLAAENRHYCTKWGFAPGTHQHTACVLDLKELRAKTYQRVSAEVFP